MKCDQVMWCLFLVYHTRAFGQNLIAAPSTILKGLTERLDVNCTYFLDNTINISSITSISISHWESSHFQELATVNTFNGISSSLPAANLTISGHIDGSGYLNLTWNTSSAVHRGVYQCNVRGLDATGHPVTLFTTVNVTGVNLESELLIEEIIKLRNYIDLQESEFLSFKEQVSTFITTWTHRMSSARKTLFNTPATYNGSQYYIYTQTPVNIPGVAQASCELIGGNLVEVDDADEYDFVHVLIRQYSVSVDYRIHFFVIGGSQDGDAEHWYYPHSNESLEYYRWAPDYPIDNPVANCLTLWRYYDWNMTNIDCDRDQKNYPISFMCEVEI
ncbi:Bg selectin 1 [Biomphalaria glabrata]|nr:Bg selectin 1 [Biomphalaria glabrata]